MADIKERIQAIELELKDLKLQMEAGEAMKWATRLERYKTLEKHFKGTPYEGSHFRFSTARKDTVKLCICPYVGNGRYEGGLYENGPSFKLIVALLEQLKETSGG